MLWQHTFQSTFCSFNRVVTFIRTQLDTLYLLVIFTLLDLLFGPGYTIKQQGSCLSDNTAAVCQTTRQLSVRQLSVKQQDRCMSDNKTAVCLKTRQQSIRQHDSCLSDTKTTVCQTTRNKQLVKLKNCSNRICLSIKEGYSLITLIIILI